MITGVQEPKLLDQLRSAMRLKHYSYRTEQSYVQWVKRFILFHQKRHPKDMGATEIRQFLNHLAMEKNVAGSTKNQSLCAIIFLYKQILNIEPGELGTILWAKRPKRLPVVFYICFLYFSIRYKKLTKNCVYYNKNIIAGKTGNKK